jgi:hypothetical protein
MGEPMTGYVPPQAIPTPSLLPGILLLGLRKLCQRRSSAEAEA